MVYEPARHLMVDVFPCADGHAQERALLPAIVNTVQRGEVWIGDRNFCVIDFLVGIAERGASFIVREHEQLRFTPQEAMGDRGRVETGMVAEQPVVLTRAGQPTLAVRRIGVQLEQPTRDGDHAVYLLTNLPKAVAAALVARAYRGRWTLEIAFQVLATALASEIDTLAYSQAALFGFCVAIVTYNVLAIAKAALAQTHGVERIDREFSDYYLAAELDAVAAGMEVALPAAEWQVFRTLPIAEFVAFLLILAQNVRLARFKQYPRGPKKPAPKRPYDPKHLHVATAKLIAARKERAAC